MILPIKTVEFSIPFRKREHPNSWTATENASNQEIKSSFVTMVGEFGTLKSLKFFDCDFALGTISKTTFQNCSFSNCRMAGITFEKVEFHKCKFLNCYIFKPRFDSVYIDPGSFSFDPVWKRQAANVNTSLFQWLFKNSKNEHQEIFAEKADKNYRIYKRWEQLGKNGHWDWFKTRVNFVLSFMYQLCLGFGYNISNALVSSSLVFTSLAFIASCSWSHLGIKNGENASLITKIYFMIVTWATVGFGDLFPEKDVGKMVVSAFVVISVLWISTITAIFVKRVTR